MSTAPVPVAPITAPPAPPTLPGPATVLGDGTTGASRVKARWHRARWPITVLVALVTVGVLTSLMGARTSTVPLAPDNPRDGGARALAEILRDQGVRIEYVRTLGDATARARAGTTLLVTTTTPLFNDQVDRLAEVPADLVLIEPVSYHLAELTGGAVGFESAGGAGLGATEPRAAECSDPDATAAGEIVADRATTLVATSPDTVTCFPAGPGAPGGAYAVVQRPDRRIVVVDDADLMTNAALAAHGNAALLLRTLGRHDVLIWYVPSSSDLGEVGGARPSTGDLLPSWFGFVSIQAALVVLALALWRGRRLGRVVVEPLPVTVRAAETTLGRGRLYRRSRSRGHAAAALRAGTARRAASRLGLPRTAGATDVIDTLARATDRPVEQVTGLLYGPPPTDDIGLLQLARQLDELESEVHRT